MKMYIGNLSYDTTETSIRETFETIGEVTDVHIPMDRETGRPRGFAFVTMASKNDMVQAIKDLDGTELDGRDIRVNEARPKENRNSSPRRY